MENNNGFEDFYNLERKIFEASDRQRVLELNERKKLYKGRSSTPSSRKSVITREKMLLIIIFIMLIFLIRPVAQAYFIKSKISNVIQESDEIRKNIVDSLMYSNENYTIDSLPKNIYINKTLNNLKIDIGQTGKKIVNGLGYIYLDPIISKNKNFIRWQCKASGTGIKEGYLPNNCRLLK